MVSPSAPHHPSPGSLPAKNCSTLTNLTICLCVFLSVYQSVQKWYILSYIHDHGIHFGSMHGCSHSPGFLLSTSPCRLPKESRRSWKSENPHQFDANNTEPGYLSFHLHYAHNLSTFTCKPRDARKHSTINEFYKYCEHFLFMSCYSVAQSSLRIL